MTTTLGIFLSANKKKKMQIYAQLYEFNEQLILTLKFSHQSIDKIAEPFNYVSEFLQGKVPTGADGEFIKEYLNNLGKTDALSQIDYLTERKSVLKKYKEESLADYKKYSSLYIKIFFLIGVMVAILLA